MIETLVGFSGNWILYFQLTWLHLGEEATAGKMVLDSCGAGAMMRFFAPWQTLRDQIFSSLINESKPIKEENSDIKNLHSKYSKLLRNSAFMETECK